jgi:hypothetical protein
MANPRAPDKPGTRTNSQPLTIAALAEAKGLPGPFLEELGLRDLPHGGVGIPYYDLGGEPIAVKRRTALKATDGSFWPKGRPLAAYGDWQLHNANRAGLLVLVEGESDCWALWHHGIPALGIPGANSVKVLTAEHVACVQKIYVHREPDQGGGRFVAGVVSRLKQLAFSGQAYEIRCPEGVKDPADLHLQAPGQDEFCKAFGAAMLAGAPLDMGGSGPSNLAGEGEPLGLALTCLSTIRPKPVRWLVPGYLPLGKLVLIAGDGGHGKSTLTLAVTACLTTGRPCLGLAHDPPPPAEVLLVSCEDDFEDTVVPRLLSAGADLARVFRVDGVKTKDGKPAAFSLAHFDAIEEELLARPDIRLVVVDPAGAYIGKSGVDDYNDSELRSLLGPLAELAARRQVTILLVKHLVKGATAKAVHKVGGSAGYVNSVRAAFVVAPDPEDEHRKLFLPLKFNLGPHPSGLAYRLQPLGPEGRGTVVAQYGGHLDAEDQARLSGQLFAVEWLGAVDVDANKVFAEAARRERGPTRVDEAAEWLEKFLARYAYPSAEVFAAGAKAGFTEKNLYGAKKKLEGKVKAGNRGRFGGVWHWGIGPHDQWVVRPVVGNPDSPPADNGNYADNADNGEIDSHSCHTRQCRQGSPDPDEGGNNGGEAVNEWGDPL